MSNKHIAAVVTKKNTRNAVLAVRQQFKGKDVVNVRECMIEGENEFAPTKSGFTIPAANFAEFFKSLRKFGRAAGLLGKAGDEDFEVKDFDDIDGNEDEIVIGKAAKEDGEEKSGKTGIKRKAKAKDLEAIAKKKRPTDDDAPKGKKAKAKVEEDDGDDDESFDMKAFKKAIKAAVKHDDDTDLAKAVVTIYKENRKMLKDKLPKHAVNALEKSLASKKDEALMEKAVAACQKHIVEKDFSL